VKAVLCEILEDMVASNVIISLVNLPPDARARVTHIGRCLLVIKAGHHGEPLTTKNARLVVDLQGANADTVADPYVLPTVDAVLQNLAQGRYFVAIDFVQSFHQCALDDDSVPLTAFNTPLGIFCFKRLPMGSRNATAAMQSSQVLMFGHLNNPLEGRVLESYVDDTAGSCDTKEGAVQMLVGMLDQCRKYNAVLNFDKCTLEPTERIVLLGSVISYRSIAIDPERVRSLISLPLPASSDQALRFIGMCCFLAVYVPRLQEKLTSLRACVAAPGPFRLSQLAEVDCRSILDQLVNAVPRVVPGPDEELRIWVDASDKGIGGLIMTMQNELIACFSALLSDTQQKYDALGKELVAATRIAKRFAYLLRGRVCTLFSDHLNLTREIDVSNHELNPRVARAVMFLRDNFPEMSLEHWPGKLNVAADALSRAYICAALTTGAPASALPAFLEDQKTLIVAGYAQDKKLQAVYAALTGPVAYRPTSGGVAELLRLFVIDPEGLVWFDTPNPSPEGKRLVIPADALHGVLQKLHQSKGHPGAARLAGVFNQRLFGFSVEAEARRVVALCHRCQISKHATRAFGTAHPGPMPTGRFLCLAMDTIMGLPPGTTMSGRSVNQILLVLDTFSGYTILIPISSSSTANQFVSWLHERVFAYFGVPLTILVDRQSQFTSDAFVTPLAKMGIKVNHVGVNHHVGQAEIRIKGVRDSLRITAQLGDGSDWPLHLSSIEFDMNALPSKRHGTTPFMAALGYTPRAPLDLPDPASGASISFHQARQLAVHKQVLAHLLDARTKMREQFDGNRIHTHFNVNDRAYVHPDAVSVKSASGGSVSAHAKMRPVYIGPYPVLEATDEFGITTVKLPGTSRASSKIALQFLKPAPSTMAPTTRAAQSNPSVEQAELILNRRQTPDGAEYLVKYSGLSIDHARWVAASAVTDMAVVERFQREQDGVLMLEDDDEELAKQQHSRAVQK
jgi:hypothetical protein